MRSCVKGYIYSSRIECRVSSRVPLQPPRHCAQPGADQACGRCIPKPDLIPLEAIEREVDVSPDAREPQRKRWMDGSVRTGCQLGDERLGLLHVEHRQW